TFPFVFTATLPGAAGTLLVGMLAFATIVSSGVARTLLFMRITQLSGASSADDPRLAATNGLLTQWGAAGALAGPPAAGVLVDRLGWGSLGLAASLMVLALAATITAAEWLGSKRKPLEHST
ncbi:MAG: hypothetical protein M3Y41_17470, partial [Pseudomonadota bacterium]|nr:hypothetical protein [Pseudomonadota bacterium]